MLTDEALEAVESLADAERAAQVIAQLLAALPPEQHDAIDLRILQERAYDEIAAELRCSSAVVRQRVSRALATPRHHFPQEAP